MYGFLLDGHFLILCTIVVLEIIKYIFDTKLIGSRPIQICVE